MGSGGGGENRLDGGNDLGHLGHAAIADFATGQIAGAGADLANAARAQGGDVGLGGGMLPHEQIHRGRHQDRLVRGQQQGRGKIVGQTRRHLGHQIGAGGGDDHQIGGAAQLNMAHAIVVGQGEQVVMHRLARQGRDRQRSDELGSAFGQNAGDRRAFVFQAANQLKGFVGGDASGNDQEDAAAGERHGKSPLITPNWMCKL